MLDKRLQHSTNKLAQIQTELTEEKDLRKALQLNQTSWQAKYKKLQDELSTKEAEITDLKEQNRDLMFFLDAQKQIDESVDRNEIATGRIVIPSSPKDGKSSGSRGYKNQKRH